ncbi:DoxX family protein [Georgenia sp. EYE_87]|uniref:DoxX family protein n=1 Tax=Georgenia sp. EYE_87 TaxID=2853448 RepID=UPI00200661AB|nr:DoxX family protein [Georgenia sp. EYE_87]MCK6212294.1 DoxX family protein [Georgenia sp. EYE_87]
MNFSTLFTPASGTAKDVLLLVARVALGIVFLAHGLQKMLTWGMPGTAAAFEGMGVPAPGLSAWFSAIVETVGGAALILGLLTPLFAALLTINMVGALVIVHLPFGIWVMENGYELVLALAAGAVALIAAGAGRFSLDAVLAARATARTAEREPALAGSAR